MRNISVWLTKCILLKQKEQWVQRLENPLTTGTEKEIDYLLLYHWFIILYSISKVRLVPLCSSAKKIPSMPPQHIHFPPHLPSIHTTAITTHLSLVLNTRISSSYPQLLWGPRGELAPISHSTLFCYFPGFIILPSESLSCPQLPQPLVLIQTTLFIITWVLASLLFVLFVSSPLLLLWKVHLQASLCLRILPSCLPEQGSGWRGFHS